MDAFIKDILLQAGNLRTNNVMFTFGSDFQYESAIENYKNIDKLMEYTMQKVHIHIICMRGKMRERERERMGELGRSRGELYTMAVY